MRGLLVERLDCLELGFCEIDEIPGRSNRSFQYMCGSNDLAAWVSCDLKSRLVAGTRCPFAFDRPPADVVAMEFAVP